MGRIDPNLRDVLDSLSVRDGVRHPTQDLETLRTIVDRLRPEDQRARDLAPEAGAPRPEEDLHGLHETEEPVPEEDDAERDDLGGLSFDTEPLTEEEPPEPEEEVRFERVDVPPPAAHDLDPYADAPIGDWADEDDLLADEDDLLADETLMEFESTGPADADEEDDWSVPAPDARGATETSTTVWDDDEAALAEVAELERALQAAEAATHHQASGGHDAAAPDADTFTLEPDAADDLAELERQLAELERDLEALGTIEPDDEDPSARKRRDSDRA